MEQVHIIKLAAGVTDLAHLYDIQRREEIPYRGGRAVPCWTRYKPKRAEEILRTGGSLYRVAGGRIICRHKILGFETVETQDKGTMCMIMQDSAMIETAAMPRRAFQGWRYLKTRDVPPDKGVYRGGQGQDNDDIPPEIETALRAAGIL